MFDATTRAAYLAASTAQARAEAVRDSLGSGTLTVELRDGATLVYSGTFSGPMTASNGALSVNTALSGAVTDAGTPSASTWTCRIHNGSGRYIEGSFGPGGRFTWTAGALVVGRSVKLNVSVAAPSAVAWPAWRQGLDQWEWIELTGTSAFSGEAPTDTNYGAASGRLDAWNGFAAIGKAVYIAGMGGHADYSGNEAYKLDLDVSTPDWVMLREPSAWADRVSNTAYYADGRPNSAHLYYTLWGVGGNLIRCGNYSHWSGGQTTDQETVEFNLTANDWTCATGYSGPSSTWADAPVTGIGLAHCQDPADGTIYAAGATHLHKRHPTTGVWTQLAAFPDFGSSTRARGSAVDTSRLRICFFGDDYQTPLGGLLYDITAGTLERISFSSVDANVTAALIASDGGHSAWYDATLDRFIVKTSTGANTYLVHPTTWVVTAQSTTGGGSIVNAANGVFNKFVRLPELGGIFYQPSHSSNGWFLATE